VNASPHLQLENAMLRRELQWACLKIEPQQAELRRERISKCGPPSETRSDLQLELLEEEPGVSSGEGEAESRREPAVGGERREGKLQPVRQHLPESLPRVEDVIACTERNCGAETQ
jgi:hypothetical protein